VVSIPEEVDGSFGTEIVQIGPAHRLSIRPDSISHINTNKLDLIVFGVLQSVGDHVKGFMGGLRRLHVNSV
jgi:hypothetical protein